MIPEIGKTYRMTHSRFGTATVYVTGKSGEWVDIEIVEGLLWLKAGTLGVGCTKSVRESNAVWNPSTGGRP